MNRRVHIFLTGLACLVWALSPVWQVLHHHEETAECSCDGPGWIADHDDCHDNCLICHGSMPAPSAEQESSPIQLREAADSTLRYALGKITNPDLAVGHARGPPISLYS